MANLPSANVLSIRNLVTVTLASLALVSVACSAQVGGVDGEDPGTESAAASTKEGKSIPAEAAPFVGTWKIVKKPEVNPTNCSRADSVVVEAGMSSTTLLPDNEEAGPYLVVNCGDEIGGRYLDKAPFSGIGQPVRKATIDMGGGQAWTVSHKTTASKNKLVHTSTIDYYKAWVVPVGREVEIQELTIEGDKMVLRVSLDGKVNYEWEFARP
ncbi:MAG: hypothetical protein U0169_07035 [Polyangiaceae bacterium]